MNPRFRMITCFLLVVLLFLSMSCALIPKSVQQFIGEDNADGETDVIYVTATPQMGASVSQTELVIKPCLYNSDCPGAVDLDDMLNAQQKKSYEIKLPHNAQLKLSNGWVAIDDETLQENLTHIKWILEVDGVDIFQPEFVVKATVKTIQDTSTENSGAWVGVAMEGFALNEPVILEVGYTFTEAVNDGWEDFPAGYTSTITYHFLPQPADYGLPTIK